MSAPPPPARRTIHLSSAGMQLTLSTTTAGEVTVRLTPPAGAPPDSYANSQPIAVEMVADDGNAQWLTGTYERVTPDKTGVTCIGTITSPNGSTVQFTDRYEARSLQKDFLLKRTVTVAEKGRGDAGFSTRFSLKAEKPTTTQDGDFLAPGVWYMSNRQVPPGALAANLDEKYFLFREERLPLPLVAFRDRRSGHTIMFHHVGGNPTTFAGETGRTRIIDERMQFGALGFINQGQLEAVFQMPGSEGERSYVGPKRPGDDGWSYRSHPVTPGFSHRYTLRLQINHANSYPEAVRRAWGGAVKEAKPPLIKADLARVYKVSNELLGIYCRKYNGVISVPFQARVPSGEVIDTSSQMGFVGMALPCAALMLEYGLETRNEDLIQRANEIVTFWVTNGMAPNGIPRNWYDILPDGSFRWRPYHTFLRIASDGVGGALWAWNLSRRARQERPEWLEFCRRYGDWLVKAQNPDGSYFRAYNLDGTPQEKSLDTTDHPIAFLCDLYRATGDARYRDAAVRAGNYCLGSVHRAYAYVGGTPDNPNVTDKEAGLMALSAFLGLHDVTGDRRWLDAAVQAAWFCDTWVYYWNIPMPPDATELAFPRNRTTHGMSLIATGHSGADNFMALAPFLYYRVYLLTGETHFRDMAHRLMHDTKQQVNWDGTLGYRYHGLLTEALSLVSPRGKGVMGWLPWLTVTVLDPMVRLREVFGNFDISQIEKLPKAERLRRNRDYAQHRGFRAAVPRKMSSAGERNV